MERSFIFDKFNTWYDWRFYLTSKDIPYPEPDTHLVQIDGMSGTLDLSEALTGEVTYRDRTITATFWSAEGSRKERERVLRDIAVALHGRKVKIIEPDDPDHYLLGRVKIKSRTNITPYAEFTIEAVCEPWRYALYESERKIDVNSQTAIDVVITNNGIKTLCPTISVDGSVNIIINGVTTSLATGSYKIAELKLRHGANVVGVSGAGRVVFTYREGDL